MIASPVARAFSGSSSSFPHNQAARRQDARYSRSPSPTRLPLRGSVPHPSQRHQLLANERSAGTSAPQRSCPCQEPDARSNLAQRPCPPQPPPVEQRCAPQLPAEVGGNALTPSAIAQEPRSRARKGSSSDSKASCRSSATTLMLSVTGALCSSLGGREGGRADAR